MRQKTLLVVRHAKSCWLDDSLDDIDRPLNPRGIANAPEMGQRLLQRKHVPDRIISSAAVRAFATAAAIAAKLDYPKDDIFVADNLYHGSKDDVLGVIEALSEVIHTGMIVLHNPTITELANHAAAEEIDNVPTCGVLLIEAATWAGFREDGTLIDFDYPKRPQE